MATGGGGGDNSTDRHGSGDKVYARKSSEGPMTNKSLANSKSQELNFAQEIPDDSFSLSRFQGAYVGQGEENLGLGALVAKKVISINVAFRSKKEKHDLRRKLQNELRIVRNWVRKIERNGSKKYPVNDVVHKGKLKRVHSEVGSIGGPESRPLEPLSMPVMEHSLGVSDNTDKEKRTPKANQFYQNSNFVSGKERNLLPSDQNKKLKAKAKGGEFGGSGFEMGNHGSKVFKSCRALLDKLMKHKHGWVFNTPVDVEGLGLHDYHLIIKQPMDLGTIKSRLTLNDYQTPKDFAEDVRLTFHNALTYNPEGHDVNQFARQLLKIFEDRWAVIEADYSQEVKVASDYDVGLPTPTSKMVAPPPPPPPPPPPLAEPAVELMTVNDRSEFMSNPRPPTPVNLGVTMDKLESMTNPGGSKAKNSSNPPSGRAPHSKKPRAKDPDKRDMTFEEKQKLSASLQSLPSEKLGNVVQIIKKRNPSLCQSDDEIEVDIDSVDIETLWELDRFVVNYKKHMSKIKRIAEMAQVTIETESNLPREAAPLTEEPKENITAERNAPPSTPIHRQEGDNLSNASSSFTTGTRSSSDSDSDSSSS